MSSSRSQTVGTCVKSGHSNTTISSRRPPSTCAPLATDVDGNAHILDDDGRLGTADAAEADGSRLETRDVGHGQHQQIVRVAFQLAVLEEKPDVMPLIQVAAGGVRVRPAAIVFEAVGRHDRSERDLALVIASRQKDDDAAEG